MENFKTHFSEGTVSSVAAIVFVKKMTTPFEKWEEFQTGIIDKNGKILKGKLGVFHNIARKIKILFHRFVPNKHFLNLLLVMYLLKKEDIADPIEEIVKEELDKQLSEQEKDILLNILNEVSNTSKSVGDYSEKFFIGRNLSQREANQIWRRKRKERRDQRGINYDPKTGLCKYM